ncbi:YozQ family protein [Oceanobacillus saliphilus]|uniref:YozQ family protein n=1 Tax=Oceanobacillus saliphilus TaxID=2925834 RepID=UPI00201DA049|nr:YozQ family protein [Oceanobacillus saliphilus]
MEKKIKGKAKTVADKTYQYSDYYSNDQLSKGMAESHEQVSDAYMEGTVDRFEGKNGRDDHKDNEDLPRKL